jgi:hypothetical protein
MPFDSQYFLEGLAMQVAEYHQWCYVRIVTHTLGDLLVHSVVKTYDGSVTLNVWKDSMSNAPIVAGSSSFHEFDVRHPTTYYGITVPFEEIVTVVVVAAPNGDGAYIKH